jgi:hypothetical protein
VSERDYGPWVARLRGLEPGALAVLLQGGHARGDAGPYSDIDLRIVTAGPPLARDRAFLEEDGGRIVHYSVGSRPLDELVSATADALIWPWLAAHYETVRPLWDPHDLVGLLRRSVEANRPGPLPYVDGLFLELEAMVEEVAKVRNAAAVSDYLTAARAAYEAGDLAWKVLQRCADPRPLANQAAGVERMLALGQAIPGYRADLAICMGLTPEPRPLETLSRAAVDLAEGVVTWVETWLPRRPETEAVRAFLGEGRLLRYVRQMRG